jgi:RNA polymerase sigma factor (sigma-70 family)
MANEDPPMTARQPPDPENALLPDEDLVGTALVGNANALRQLLTRHQTWIYNLTLYMLHSRQDAEDATQEILVKIATGLSGFNGNSSFRTWARRIAVNHALDCRRSRPERVVTGFDCYAEYLDKAPDTEFLAKPVPSPEQTLLVDEARIACVMGMLLCLDRNQRIVFLLGELLETSDVVAAELMDISRDNFRQQLSRSREQLSNFMQGRCGLVNPQNPCRCARKTRAFIKDGIVDPNRLQFARGHLRQVEAVIDERRHQLEGIVDRVRSELYPLFEAPDFAGRLGTLLNGEDVQTALGLN